LYIPSSVLFTYSHFPNAPLTVPRSSINTYLTADRGRRLLVLCGTQIRRQAAHNNPKINVHPTYLISLNTHHIQKFTTQLEINVLHHADKVLLARNYATYHEDVRARGGRHPRILNPYHVEEMDWLQASAAFT